MEIEDDDGADLLALETESLRQAMIGIVVEGVIVIDGGETTEDDRKGEKKDGAGQKTDSDAVLDKPMDFPGLCHNARKTRVTIDHVLNPPIVPQAHTSSDALLALLKQLTLCFSFLFIIRIRIHSGYSTFISYIVPLKRVQVSYVLYPGDLHVLYKIIQSLLPKARDGEKEDGEGED